MLYFRVSLLSSKESGNLNSDTDQLWLSVRTVMRKLRDSGARIAVFSPTNRSYVPSFQRLSYAVRAFTFGVNTFIQDVTLQAANAFLSGHYVAEFNRKFTVLAPQKGSAFLPCPRRNLDLIFSQQFERTVDRDNTVGFHPLVL
jgi:hypothetical protein